MDVTSGYLIDTTGYFWLLLVTSGYFSLLLVPRFSNNDKLGAAEVYKIEEVREYFLNVEIENEVLGYNNSSSSSSSSSSNNNNNNNNNDNNSC